MVRRTALPEAVASIPRQASSRCGLCDTNTPSFLCPKCPRRAAGEKSDDEHGWAFMRRQWQNFPAMYDCLRRDAELARTIAVTHESHPAYPEMLRAYQDNGMRLGQLRQQHREMLREAARDH